MADEPLEETPTEEPETSVLPSGETPGEEPEVPAEEPQKPQEPQIPLSRLREERSRVKELQKEIETLKEGTRSVPPEDKESKEKDARDYLRRMTQEVLDEREVKNRKEEQKENEEYQGMLDEFKTLDSSFDEKKFNELVIKYKPEDEDAAWNLWQDFKTNPSPSSVPKPKIPSSKTTTDNEIPKEYNDSGKTMWEILEEAKEEKGLK